MQLLQQPGASFGAQGVHGRSSELIRNRGCHRSTNPRKASGLRRVLGCPGEIGARPGEKLSDTLEESNASYQVGGIPWLGIYAEASLTLTPGSPMSSNPHYKSPKPELQWTHAQAAKNARIIVDLGNMVETSARMNECYGP